MYSKFSRGEIEIVVRDASIEEHAYLKYVGPVENKDIQTKRMTPAATSPINPVAGLSLLQ